MKLLAKVGVPAANADALDDDRRWNKRNKLLKNVRIYRRDEPTYPEKTGTVINVSREGLYFTVQSGEYKIGMELRLVVPEAKTECMCEVVRLEPLPGRRTGIGVRVSSWQLDSLQRCCDKPAGRAEAMSFDYSL